MNLLIPQLMPKSVLTLLVMGTVLVAACADPPTGSKERAAVEVQGHRGARGLLPENSIPSFDRAIEMGVPTLELDVVVTGDSQVVVSHEPWMNPAICSTPDGRRIAEGEGRRHNLYAMTYRDVAQYDCGSLGHPDFPTQKAVAVHKPLLDSVISHVEQFALRHDRAVRYNIEIKSEPSLDDVFHPPPRRFAALVYDVIRRHAVGDRTNVQSFDPRVVDAMHGLDSTLSYALLVSNDDGLEANLGRLSFVPTTYSPHYRLVDSTLIARAAARDIRIVPWTVNDVDEMRRLVRLGVHGLITDYPDSARAAGLLDANGAGDR